VNEFVKKDFFEACSKYAAWSFARGSTVKRAIRSQDERFRKAVKDAEDRRQVSSFGSDEFKLVDILDKWGSNCCRGVDARLTLAGARRSSA